jgi:hypothetical protein
MRRPYCARIVAGHLWQDFWLNLGKRLNGHIDLTIIRLVSIENQHDQCRDRHGRKHVGQSSSRAGSTRIVVGQRYVSHRYRVEPVVRYTLVDDGIHRWGVNSCQELVGLVATAFRLR